MKPRRAKSRSSSLSSVILARRVLGRLKTAKEIERRLWRALKPTLRHGQVLSFGEGIFANCSTPQRKEGHEREAEKRRQTVGAMFRGSRSQDFVETDPTAGLKAYDPGRPRDRVLSAEEIASLWRWLAESTLSVTTADILRLQLPTGARCGEVAGMEAGEIDATEWLWTLACCSFEERQGSSYAPRGTWPAQSSRAASPSCPAVHYSRRKPVQR